jgi:hypothetical protein
MPHGRKIRSATSDPSPDFIHQSRSNVAGASSNGINPRAVVRAMKTNAGARCVDIGDPPLTCQAGTGISKGAN